MTFTVRPLTTELWPALEELFGRAGASSGCWCMYWRLGPAYKRRPRDQNKAALRAEAEQGLPPGLLAFDGELAVGWCRLTPRSAVPWLDSARHLGRVDDVPVWSVSCFYVLRAYRGRGVMQTLIAAALRAAKAVNAPALEAYPVDTSAPKATTSVFTGTASAFRHAGFTTVAQRSPARPIMRHDLEAIPSA